MLPIGGDAQNDPQTLIVEELGIRQGAARVDVAVVNGSLHGYEIKSARDTLERLPKQSELYSSVFDTITLVTAENHLMGPKCDSRLVGYCSGKKRT